MNEIRRARPLLGTLAQITALGALTAAELHAAVAAAFAQIALVHTLMSAQEPDSELSRLNRLAPQFLQPLHPHTRAVLAAGLEIARRSGGAFDPSAGTPPALNSSAAGWRDIELCEQGVRFHRPLQLDLGGIAKGYAVDLAVQCLKSLGVQHLVVNAGGDLRVAGSRAQAVAIRHPLSAHQPVHELLLQNEALATSSRFSQREGGAPGWELVDPRTGRAYCGRDSVSVRAATCMTADALTKVALFAPAALAERVLRDYAAQCIRLVPEPA